jgi:anhydro-N-acetylmuramic acid kinase
MSDWLTTLSAARQKSSRIVAGIMSGTSVDSVDVALCRISGCGIPGRDGAGAAVELISFYSHPYEPSLQLRVRSGGSFTMRDVSELHAGIGELFAEALVQGARGARINLSEIDIVGSHGQTVYHHSGVPGAALTTLQLGCGDRIAQRSGRAVFFDFRARDVAAGGQGAPLAPYADLALFLPRLGGSTEAAVLNLGGIANFTVLSRNPSRVIGFDTGPANVALDRMVRLLTNGTEQFDRDGARARSGKVNEPLLQALLASDSYLAKSPPKSTGFEVYGDRWVENLVQQSGGAVTVDLLTTATEFAARAIGDALQRFILPNNAVSTIIVAGGGAQNAFLLERITAAVAPVAVVLSDTLGVPGQAREAMAWAVLANDALCGVPTSLPSVTGCVAPLVQGKLALPG